MVLVVMMIIQVVAWAFLSSVNVEQRLAGGSVRGLAALYLAEAGVQKALRLLEVGATEPLPYRQALGAGAFTIEALEPLPGGTTAIVAAGEVGGTRRRLRVLTRVGPEALAYGMYAQGILGFAGQARTYVLPFRMSTARRGSELAAGVEVRFDGPRVALNAFRGQRLALREGQIGDAALLQANGAEAAPVLVDLVLTGPAQLVSGISHRAVSLEDLRQQVPALGVRRVRARPALVAPAVDLGLYKTLAEANTANAAINAAAGLVSAEPELRGKTHSRYTLEEFEAILAYLRQRPARTLQGVLFVDSDIVLEEGDRVAIMDGALVVEGDIDIAEGARLEIRHGRTGRTLPGIIAWGQGTIQIEPDAAVVVDGLVLAEWDVRVGAGTLDVVGAVAGRNILMRDGTVVVRYDSGVLATVGLRRTGVGRAEPLAWQEIP
jgi:hypothetical protein